MKWWMECVKMNEWKSCTYDDWLSRHQRFSPGIEKKNEIYQATTKSLMNNRGSCMFCIVSNNKACI